jgi:hypothetical protein
MKMKKDVVHVKYGCRNCPELYFGYCKAVSINGEFKKTSYVNFPDWCPLPDVEE